MLTDFARRWSYWAYYCNQVNGSVQLLANCLCGSAISARRGAKSDADKLRRSLLQGFASLNKIFDRLGFDEEELRTISDGVIEVLEEVRVD